MPTERGLESTPGGDVGGAQLDWPLAPWPNGTCLTVTQIADGTASHARLCSLYGYCGGLDVDDGCVVPPSTPFVCPFAAGCDVVTPCRSGAGWGFNVCLVDAASGDWIFGAHFHDVLAADGDFVAQDDVVAHQGATGAVSGSAQCAGSGSHFHIETGIAGITVGGTTSPPADLAAVAGDRICSIRDAAGCSISDPSLRAAVESALGVEAGAPIPTDAAMQLTSLNLSGSEVSSLEGIACLAGLREIFLSATAVTSFSPLHALGELETLVASDRPVSAQQLAEIAAIGSLRTLVIQRAGLIDVAPLGATAASFVSVAENEIVDAIPLLSNAAVVSLDIDENLVTTIPTASAALADLFAFGNRITDVGGLAQASSLNFVNLNRNQITDVAPLVLSGIGEGDTAFLQQNALDCAQQSSHLQALLDKGVSTLATDCPR